MNWITIILGVALFVAPFVMGYSGAPLALWTSLILGAVVALLGYMKSYKVAAVLGLVVFVAPWVLGFSGVSSAFWSCLLLGGGVALLAGYQGFFGQAGAGAGGAQHRSA